jgi:predicted Zn-dependent protease
VSIDPLSGSTVGNPLTGYTAPTPRSEEKGCQDTYTPGPARQWPDPKKVIANIDMCGVAPAAPAAEGAESAGDIEKAAWLRKTMAGVFIGTTLLGMAGCTNNPPTPPGTEKTSVSTELSYLLISSKDEVELGKQVAAQVEKQYKVWDNPEALARVQRLGEALAKTSTRKDITYEFKLVDTDVVNAFALPGGHIYVTRGLYNEFKNDNELSFVLGHEIGHVEDRDSIKSLERDAAFRALIQLLSKKQGDLPEVVGQVTSSIMNVRFSQKDEYQADAISSRHLVRNNINPWYGVKAMEHLKSLEKSKPGALEKFFSTHPPTSERMEKLAELAKDSPKP